MIKNGTQKGDPKEGSKVGFKIELQSGIQSAWISILLCLDFKSLLGYPPFGSSLDPLF